VGVEDGVEVMVGVAVELAVGVRLLAGVGVGVSRVGEAEAVLVGSGGLVGPAAGVAMGVGVGQKAAWTIVGATGSLNVSG